MKRVIFFLAVLLFLGGCRVAGASTEIICIIDRSGSMQSLASDAVGGFNSFLEEQKKLPGNAGLTVVLFNTEIAYMGHTNIDWIEPLTLERYKPEGSTALFDAIGKVLDQSAERFHHRPCEEQPERVLVVILTDGLENSSTEYSKDQVHDLISHYRDKHGWTFKYLAMAEDEFKDESWNQGSGLGFPGQDILILNSTAAGVHTSFEQINTMATSARTPYTEIELKVEP